MIPENRLSTTAVRSGFSYPVKSPIPEDKLQDWELAGVALGDASAGLNVKLWHCILEIDKATNTGSVYIEAPGVAKTFLFSGVDITEVALAFDQNMNPFVAYQQGSAARFFWYDPLIPGMTHTTLPAGCRDLRCTMDEKRLFDIANSDIVLSYIQSGNLCVRYQRDRYLVETVLKAGAGPDAILVSMAMNNGNRLQWRLRNYVLTDDPQALYTVDPFLADVVMGLCREAGIPPERPDVNELYNDTVPGIKVDVDEGLDKPIDWLREIYYFDKSEKDRKIFFPKRGREVVARIPYKDLVDAQPQSLKQVLVDEKKLPRIVNINHLDPDAGHAKNKQTAERRSNLVQSDVTKTIQSQVVLKVDQAATAAMTRLKVYHNELINYEFGTSIKYTYLTVGDNIEVEDINGVWNRMRIDEKNEDSGVIDWECTQDAGNLTYVTQRTGNSLPTPISTTPGLVSPTRIEIVNSSPLRDQDDELGVYIAAAGENTAWTGYQMLYSIDSGTSYAEAYRTEIPSTIGETDSDLLAEIGYEYQSNQTVIVVVNFPLASISYDQLLVNQNRICIGDEILQFQTATLLGMVGTLYRYELSGLVRARYNTVPDHWPIGTRFVLMDETVIFAQVQRAMIGVDITYKPISFGLTEDETVPTDYLFDEPWSQTEWPVDNVEAVRDGSDNVTVTFIGRARLGVDTMPYHSKYFRGYRIKFSDGHTIDTLTGTGTYNSAPVGATVQVCALNEITGEGPYSTAIAT